jgi:NAD(P)-dependent dehydrogenase (short-subunit alcohol dehydrogenase family)
VNVTGLFHLTQKAIAQMLSQGQGGHVVNVTTTLVENADVRVPSALTSLTKGGVAAVTKSLAIEYARRGIRVNAISPGVIDTPMHAADDHATLAGLHPLGRMGRVDDIVAGVLYLEAATFVTGEFLHIDGGQSAGHRVGFAKLTWDPTRLRLLCRLSNGRWPSRTHLFSRERLVRSRFH